LGQSGTRLVAGRTTTTGVDKKEPWEIPAGKKLPKKNEKRVVVWVRDRVWVVFKNQKGDGGAARKIIQRGFGVSASASVGQKKVI